MNESYDFSRSDSNPYIKKARKRLSICLDEDTFEYFDRLARETGVPCQSLISQCLRDYALKNR